MLRSSRTLVWILLLSAAAQAQAPVGRRSRPQGPPPTFTSAQAERGRNAYQRECASCHGPNLSGGDLASALNGNTFSQRWAGRSADQLFTFVHTRMPPARPGGLGAETDAAIVAFLLQVNGVQPGKSELPSTAQALTGMLIPHGPVAPTPPFMPLSPLSPPIVRVVLPNPLDHIAPVSDALLRRPPPGEWLLWRRTYDDHGFSPLRQIDRHNVARLRIAWGWSLPQGENEATPLVHDGVLFVHSYGDTVQALNAATGDLLWQYSRALPGDARVSVKRNLALYGDRLLLPTSDAHEIALDVHTGTVIWDVPIADYQHNWQVTGGPLVAEGKLLQGIAGQSPGGGAIVALDVRSGRELWRFHTIPAEGEPGANSWNGEPSDKRSGASVWTAGSYDPERHIAYFGTGNTYDTGPLLHPIHRPGISNDGLFTDSTLALDAGSGKLLWYFQHVHNDQWDLDWAFEQQLINLPVRGASHALVVTSGKMGIYEALDAATGHYVFSRDLGIQNVVSAIDPMTGEKLINPEVMVGDGKPHTICPHPGGGRNWIAGSYDAATHVVYVPMVETCMDLIPAPAGERGNLSSGVNWSIRPRPDSDGKYGRLEALNLETRQVLWTDRQRAPQSTCTLATAGGIVFAGALDRFLSAYDARTGAVLWRVRLNDVPSNCPISYSVGGRQYLAVVVGNGGSMSNTFSVLVPEIQNPPTHGGAVWVFELPESGAAPLSAAAESAGP